MWIKELQSLCQLYSISLKKLQIKQVQDSACISLLESVRQKGRSTLLVTRNQLVHLDEGFRVLRNIRGSPPYFEKRKT